MKKITGAAILLASLAACSFSGSDSSDDNDLRNDGKARLLFSKSAISRVIVPDSDVSSDDISKAELKYKLSSSGDEAVVLREWISTESKTAISLMKSETNLRVNAGIYDFTLNLYISQGGDYVLCQSGKLLARSVVAGDNQLNFNTNYVDDGTGGIKVSFTVPENVGISKIYAKLVKLNDDFTPVARDYEKTLVYDASAANSSVSYENLSVQQGYYNFVVEIYDADSVLLNTFTDLACILSCRTSSTNWVLNDINTRYSLTLVTDKRSKWSENYDSIQKANLLESITLPAGEDVSYEGNALVGWYENKNCDGEPDYRPGDSIWIDGEKTLYAKWVHSYLVSIDGVKHEARSDKTLRENLAEFGEVNKDGYTLMYIYDTDKNAVVEVADELVTDNLNLSLKWLKGEGSTENPYILNNISDYEVFASCVNIGVEDFDGKTVKLGENIGSESEPVTVMVGDYKSDTETKSFKGIFDGDGKTLTVAITGSDKCTAPFRAVSGTSAAIKNLKIAGSVNITKKSGYSNYNSSTLIGYIDSSSSVNIENCLNSVALTISSDSNYYSAGFVGKNHGNLTIKNSVFNGKLLGKFSYLGGFVCSYSDRTTNISDSVFAPEEVSDGINSYAYAFVYNNNNSGKINLSNCYYTNPLTKLNMATGENDVVVIEPVFAEKDIPSTVDLTSSNYKDCKIQAQGLNFYKFTGGKLSGEGTESSPYLINNIFDYYIFASKVNAGEDFDDKYVKLTANIGSEAFPVTLIAGYYSSDNSDSDKVRAFKGTFDGNGKTLTLAITGDSYYSAPFAYVSGATIKNLKLAGRFSSSAYYSSGFVGYADNITVENCVNSVAITFSSRYNHGGSFIGGGDKITIKNCVFNGKLLGSGEENGGFVARLASGKTAKLSNCVFAPSEVTLSAKSSYTFVKSESSSTKTFENCYYTQNFGTVDDFENTFPVSLSGAVSDKVTVAGLDFYKASLSGNGSEADPYLIKNNAEYYVFAAKVNGVDDFAGKYVKLADNIGSQTSPITTMVGKHSTKYFKGTFDGNGKTLTVDITGSSDYTAPFCCVSDCTFKNLKIEGNVTSSSKHAAGLIAYASGEVSIENCLVSAVVKSSSYGDAYNGGFVAYKTTSQKTLKIKNSVFNGKLLNGDSNSNYAKSNGGFVGELYSGIAELENCVFAPTEVTMPASGSYVFVKKGSSSYITETLTNCYYTNRFGTLDSGDNISTAYAISESDIPSGENLSKYAAAKFSVNGCNFYKFPEIFGAGTESSPYVITSKWAYEEFVKSVNFGQNYEGKYVQLAADIGSTEDPVKMIAGNYDRSPFSGIFDGNGKTLTVYISDSLQYTAPFRYVKGGSLKNLTIKGRVYSSYDTSNTYAYCCTAGLIGISSGDVTIENCANYVEVVNYINNSYAYNGGFVGYVKADTNLLIKDSVFKGKLNGNSSTQHNGGFVGCYSGATAMLTNCVFDPERGTMSGGNSKTFVCLNRTISDTTTKHTSNCWYTSTFGALDDSETCKQVIEVEANSTAKGKITVAGLCYCTVEGELEGSGTEEDPFIISNAVDYRRFAESVNQGTTYEGQFIKLNDNIGSKENPVTISVGVYTGNSSTNRVFKGSIDGNGKTLTVDISATGQYKAPFGYVDGSTIKNFNIAGHILVSKNENEYCYEAGLIGYANNVTIKDCLNTVDVEYTYYSGKYSYYIGGFVGYANETLLIEDSVFNGKFLGPSGISAAGGFVGRNNNSSNKTIKNCLFVPELLATSQKDNMTFVSLNAGTLENCYYTRMFRSNNSNTIAVIEEKEIPSDKRAAHESGKITIKGFSFYKLTDFPLGGSGSESDPYIINDELDYKVFAANVNCGTTYEGKYVQLAANIGSETNPVTAMVGDYYTNARFYGTFDGNGKTLTLAIRGVSEVTAPFGYVYSGTIKNLNVRGSVTGPKNVSGLVGYASGNSNYSKYKTITIENCFSTVEVTSEGDGSYDAGGFIQCFGYDSNFSDYNRNCTLNIKNSIFNGKILGSGSKYIGGFVANSYGVNSNNYGCSANITDCVFAPQEVVPSTSSYDRTFVRGSCQPVYKRCYYTVDLGGSDGKKAYSSLNEIPSGTICRKLSLGDGSLVYIPCDCESVGLDSIFYYTGEAIDLGSYSIKFNDEAADPVTDYSVSIETEKKIPVSEVTASGNYMLKISACGNYVGSAYIPFAVKANFPGSGTEDDPYLISSSDDWYMFTTIINTGKTDFAGKYLKLTADIGDTFNFIDVMAGYYKSSSESRSFKGTFDGNGKTITFGITGSADYTAPFGYVQNGTIKNLKVAGSLSSSGIYGSGLIGYMDGTVNIENCFNGIEFTSTYSGSAYNGGFVGYVARGGTVNIAKSTFAGKLLGSSAKSNGGFVGRGYSSSYCNANLTNCLFVPQEVTMESSGSMTFCGYNMIVTLTDCYCAQVFGSLQGNMVYPASQELPDSVNDFYVKKILSDEKEYYVPELCTFVAGDNNTFDVTGSSLQPVVSVTNAEKTFVEGSDYTVAIKDSVGNSLSSVTERGSYIFTVNAVSGSGIYGKIDVPVQVLGVLTGSGTESDPYLIANLNEWAIFAERIGFNKSYEGEFVKLTADIGSGESPVTEMTGYYKNDSDFRVFKGTLDGNGKTLTVAITGSSDYTAPFGYVQNGTIKNLKIAGSLSSSGRFGSGLIGYAAGTVNIENCFNSIEFTSTYSGSASYNGGFAGYSAGTLCVTGSVFSGKLLGSSAKSNGGFVGYNKDTVNLTNCIYTPAERTMSTSNSYTFVNSGSINISNCFYSQTFGTAQGKQFNSTDMYDTPPSEAGKLYAYNSMFGKYVECEILGAKTLPYTGGMVKPVLAVYALTEKIPETAYSLTYPEDAISAGTKTVTVTGDGSTLHGSAEMTYEIIDKINMPKTGSKSIVISEVSDISTFSFKVYDDGGPDAYYSNGCDGYLLITVPEGFKIKVDGTLVSEANWDKLSVYDGTSSSDSKLVNAISGSNKSISKTTRQNSVLLYFISDSSSNNTGLDLTITLAQ